MWGRASTPPRTPEPRESRSAGSSATAAWCDRPRSVRLSHGGAPARGDRSEPPGACRRRSSCGVCWLSLRIPAISATVKNSSVTWGPGRALSGISHASLRRGWPRVSVPRSRPHGFAKAQRKEGNISGRLDGGEVGGERSNPDTRIMIPSPGRHQGQESRAIRAVRRCRCEHDCEQLRAVLPWRRVAVGCGQLQSGGEASTGILDFHVSRDPDTQDLVERHQRTRPSSRQRSIRRASTSSEDGPPAEVLSSGSSARTAAQSSMAKGPHTTCIGDAGRAGEGVGSCVEYREAECFA